MDFGSTGGIVGGVAIIAFIAATWRYIRSFLGYLRSLIIVEVDLSTYSCFQEGMVAYMKKDLKHFVISPDKQFEGHYQFIRKYNRSKEIAIENLYYKKYIAFYNKCPFLFSSNFSFFSGGNGQSANGTQGSGAKIYYLRWTLDIDSLIANAVETYNKNKVNEDNVDGNIKRFEIIKYYGEGSIHSRNSNSNNHGLVSESPKSDSWSGHHLKSQIIIGGKRLIGYEVSDLDRGTKSEKSPFDIYAYPDHVMELVKEIMLWKSSKDWYAERDIEWRRGWLLHGKQGTGKTTLIKGIGQELDVPIILFDLASMSNTEFNNYWHQAKSYGPCIVVFEDFDSVFSKRENKLGHQGGGLSFDSILNCLSGVDEANGVFLIVTTNKVDEIDEALGKPLDCEGIISDSTRPGRIDKTIKFGAMGYREKRMIAAKMLKDVDNIDIDDIINNTPEYTAAQFKEKCTAIALEHFWNSKNVLGRSDEIKIKQIEHNIVKEAV